MIKHWLNVEGYSEKWYVNLATMTPRVDERKTSRTAVEIRVKRIVGQSPFSPCSETHLVEKIIFCLYQLS